MLASRATAPGEVLELLVEQAAQLVQLLGRAEVGGADDLVELLGEDLVVEVVLELARRWRRAAAGWACPRPLRELSSSSVSAKSISGPSTSPCLLGLAGGLVLVGLGVLALALALLGRLLVVLAALGVLVVALLAVVALGIVEIAVGHEVEVAQQLPRGAR